MSALDLPGGPQLDPAAPAQEAVRGLDGTVAAVVSLYAPPLLGAPGPALRARRERALDRARALAGWIAARPRRPAVLIQLGSALGFPDRGAESLDEDAPLGGDPDADLFAALEQAAAPAAAAGVRVVQLRAGLALSPALGLQPALQPLLRLGLRPRRLGAFVPWVDLDDLIDVVRAALHEPALAGPVHLVSPGQLSGADLLRALAGRPLLPAPGRLCARLSPGLDLPALLGASRRLRPSALLALGWRPRRPWPG